ncbi:MAG: tyrosine-type recombinase/integrase [Pseudomonadota bacterium]
MEKIKRSGGTFRFREMVWVDNKPLKSPCFKRMTDAKEWRKRKEAEKFSFLSRGESTRPMERFYFKDYVLKWLKEIVLIERSPRTYEYYEGVCRNYLIPSLGKYSLNEIKEHHVRASIAQMKVAGCNAKGINNRVSVLKTIMIRAKRDKLVAENPLDCISRLKEDLTVASYWSKKEIEQFLLVASRHYLFPLFFVAIHTGMRLAELCGLCWDRIDFQRDQITVSRIRDKLGLKETTKTNSKRIVPMSMMVKGLLWKLMKMQINTKFVFCNQKGREIKYNHIYRDFRRVQTNAGFTKFIRFHDLRHTFASQFMMNGGSVFDLQKILGHSEIQMTMKYTHFSPDHLQSAVRFMDMGTSAWLGTYPDPNHGQNKIENLSLISTT